MKRILLITFTICFLLIASPSARASENITITTEQKGPLNPGGTYGLKIKALDTDGKPCSGCKLSITFKEPQPLDTIEPIAPITTDEGTAYANITSYVPIDREVVLKLNQPQNETAEKEVRLKYRHNFLLSAINSIKKIQSLGISLPPMGNVYIKATKQSYNGDGTRKIYLTYNSPLGTKIFNIYHYFSLPDGTKTEQLLKSTKDTNTTIDISAIKDVEIHIEACTTSSSCVGPYGLFIPAMNSKEIESTKEFLPVPNDGVVGNTSKEKDQFLEKEEKEIKGNPFINLLKAVYR